MDIRRIASIKDGQNIIGNRTRVKVVKNKLAPPFREAEFDMFYGKGISRSGDIIDLGLAQDIFTRSGTWFSYGEERLGQGRERVRLFLEENPELMLEIETRIKEKLGLIEAPDTGDKAADSEKADEE